MPVIDFESGITGWTSVHAWTDLLVETTNPGSGTQSLRMEFTTTDTIAQATYTLTGLTPERFYKIRYKVAHEFAVAPTNVYSWIEFPDGASASYEVTSAWSDASESLVFVSGSTATIILSVTAGGSTVTVGDAFLVDDISYEEYTGISYTFESDPLGTYVDPLGWFGYSVPQGTAAVSDVVAHGGTKSLEITKPGQLGDVFQHDRVMVSPPYFPASWDLWGLEYTFSVWVYVPTGEQAAKVGAHFYSTNAGLSNDYVITQTSTLFDTWEQLTITIDRDTLAYYYPDFAFVFSGADDSAASLYYIDDIQFTVNYTNVGTSGVVRTDDLEYYTDEFELTWYWWSISSVASTTPTEFLVDNTIFQSGTQSARVSFGAPTSPPPFSGSIDGRTTLRAELPAAEYPTGSLDLYIDLWVRVPTGSSPITVATVDIYSDLIINSATTTLFDTWEQISLLVSASQLATGISPYLAIFPTDHTVNGSLAYIDSLYVTALTPTTQNVVGDITTAPMSLTGHTTTVTQAQLQGRENAAVNKALTPKSPNQFTGLCLNADIALGDLTFNRIDEDGVVWVITDIDGWWTMPDPEVKDYPRGMGDGSYDVQGRWLARNLTLNGVILPPDPSFVPYARDNLIRAASLVYTGAWLRVDEQPTKVSYVRLSGRPAIQTVNARGRTEFSIGLRAPDPIKYSWDFTDPDGYTIVDIPCRDIGTSTGLGTVINDGNISVRIIIEITGPLVGPTTIRNLTTEELIYVIEPVDPGSTLEINTYDQVVALDGQTYGVRSMLDTATDWIHLRPGVNTLEFIDTGEPNSTASMRIYYRSGWIG